MTIWKQNEINARHSTPLRRLRNWVVDFAYWLVSPVVALWMRLEERKSQRLWRAKIRRLESLLSLECEGKG